MFSKQELLLPAIQRNAGEVCGGGGGGVEQHKKLKGSCETTLFIKITNPSRPIIMTMMRKTDSAKLARMWCSQDSPTSSVGVQHSAGAVEIPGRIHQSRANTYIHQDLAISPLATYPNEICTTITENLDQECAALFATAPSWKHPTCAHNSRAMGTEMHPYEGVPGGKESR